MSRKLWINKIIHYSNLESLIFRKINRQLIKQSTINYTKWTDNQQEQAKGCKYKVYN
jgi:hypothetical protein